MPKYTQGPWGFEDGLDLPEIEYAASIKSESTGQEIGRVANYETTLKETEANAILIASVPELLEDVQNLINDIEEIFHPAVLNGMGKQDVKYHLEKAKLDLKKAKGGNNNE
jgi:hypothetical protein